MENKKVVVAFTGVSGNMGREAVPQTMELECVEKAKLFFLNTVKEKQFASKMKRKYGHRVEIIFGDVANFEDCRQLVKGCDYVVNLAAVIPPTSDHEPVKTERCNYQGTKNLVDAIEELGGKQPKLVHISTVATYGHRNYIHPWGECADPLLNATYDAYAATKVRGERYVLESDLKEWVVLRQTGILHSRMLTNNMKDGLMFHTCFNVPIEWVTARDSGLLIKNIIKRDVLGEVDDFWKRIYNIGGGAKNRVTGYDTFNEGFKIIGGSAEQFMRPGWNSIRNFHCMWFLDSDVLNDYFDFQKEDVKDYWQEILAKHPYYRLAKMISPKVISKLAIQRLLPDENSPMRWVKDKNNGKVKAYFGSTENLNCMPTTWDEYPVLAKGQLADANIDYEAIRNIKNVDKFGFRLKHGYDESKPDSQLDIEDMRQAAAFRGGKCLSQTMTKGDLYTKLEWECHDGHRFFAKPYTILKCGHWCPECCETPNEWTFDRLAKVSPFHAQVWYDTHAKGENYRYFYDAKHNARFVYEQQ